MWAKFIIVCDEKVVCTMIGEDVELDPLWFVPILLVDDYGREVALYLDEQLCDRRASLAAVFIVIHNATFNDVAAIKFVCAEEVTDDFIHMADVVFGKLVGVFGWFCHNVNKLCPAEVGWAGC